MLGWMIVFGLLTLLTGSMDVVSSPGAPPVSMTVAMVVFGLLFLVCLLTSVVRGRA